MVVSGSMIDKAACCGHRCSFQRRLDQPPVSFSICSANTKGNDLAVQLGISLAWPFYWTSSGHAKPNISWMMVNIYSYLGSATEKSRPLPLGPIVNIRRDQVSFFLASIRGLSLEIWVLLLLAPKG